MMVQNVAPSTLSTVVSKRWSDSIKKKSFIYKNRMVKIMHTSEFFKVTKSLCEPDDCNKQSYKQWRKHLYVCVVLFISVLCISVMFILCCLLLCSLFLLLSFFLLLFIVLVILFIVFLLLFICYPN
jgi:hypothetical protein